MSNNQLSSTNLLSWVCWQTKRHAPWLVSQVEIIICIYYTLQASPWRLEIYVLNTCNLTRKLGTWKNRHLPPSPLTLICKPGWFYQCYFLSSVPFSNKRSHGCSLYQHVQYGLYCIFPPKLLTMHAMPKPDTLLFCSASLYLLIQWIV